MYVFIENNNIAMYLLEQNKHWEDSFFYNISFIRDIFPECEKLLNNKYITRLIGIRRVGKSTIMKQMIDLLIKEKKIPRKNILYFSFDIIENIPDVLDQYRQRAEISFKNDNIYLFLDEIQKVKNWQAEVKMLYDLYPNIKIIVSGSASLLLQKTESLAGRIFTKKIKPLSFSEFLRFIGKDNLLVSPLLFEKELQELFQSYVFRQFFDIAESPIQDVKDYMLELQKKIIREDIPQYYQIGNYQILEKIFIIISNNPGMLLDYKNLSNDLNVDWRTLEKYITFLESSFLIKRVFNYSSNALTSEKKLKKVYLETPSFSPKIEIDGTIFENSVLQTLDTKFFYKKGTQEVDFVLHDEQKTIPIEVKWKNKVKKNEIKHLKSFQKKFTTNSGVVISKVSSESFGDIKIIPFWEMENEFV